MHRGDELDFLEEDPGHDHDHPHAHPHDDSERRIKLTNLTKMEGHGSLDIKIKDNKVKYVKLKITESKRFYTQAIRNRPALSLPLMTSRICGTCSIAHLTCCSDAVEHALGYVPSDQTLLLRKLSLYGMMIRDHALHLYLFCLPDLFSKDSILDFDKSQDEMIKKAFMIKGVGNDMSKVVAGRAVHATFAEVGRFSHIPQAGDVKKLVEQLKSVRGYVIEFIELFYNCDFTLNRDIDFVSLLTKDFSFSGGMVGDSTGTTIEENKYWDYLERVVIPYSEATGYDFKGRDYMVGALARMNLNRDALHSETKSDAAEFLKPFPSKNIFHNNLAQSIEILHCIDHSIELLESSSFVDEKHDPIQIKEGMGVGILEAPRGLLYYMLSIDKTGKVNYGNIIVPTQQNQIGMEKGVVQLIESDITATRADIEYGIEKLIRAYDPCMSCASHFLRINWKQ